MSPGSLPLSTSIYQEGIRIPPLRLYQEGKLNQDVLRLFLSNVRTPQEREGDLRAQLAAHQTGARRLVESTAKYGLSTIRARGHDLLDYGEVMMKATLAGIPDGVYRFRDFLDGDGITGKALPIEVCIHIRGERAVIDFTGTAPACAGSLNAVEAITRSAVYYCFLCLLVTPSRLHPIPPATPPLNTGCFRPLTVDIPSGSLLNALPPHAVAGGNVETSQRVVDVVFGALAGALPDLIPAASQGTMNNLTLGGVQPGDGRPYAYYETIAGGMGARPNAPGMHGVQAHMTNTQNTPIEALEFAYPFRMERYALRMGSGGAGRVRGGHGVTRTVRMLAPTEGVILSERRIHSPYGLEGGSPGACGRNRLTRNGKTRELPGKCQLQLEPGDILRIDTPGGGGHGSA
jgi:N-methylhydantoinase B